MQKIHEEALACHNLAMQHMAERSFNQKFMPWKVGDKVWLSTAHLITKLPSKKLSPKCYSPFTIDQVLSPITYHLKLLKHWKVHPTFHASELTPFTEMLVHGPNCSEPPPDLIDGEEEHEIDTILTHKGQKGRVKYLVSWKGYPSSDNTWLSEKELKHA